MSDQSRSTSAVVHLARTRKLTLIVAGTGVALLAAGVLFQILRAWPVEAAGRQTSGAQKTGTQKAAGKFRSRPPMASVDG